MCVCVFFPYRRNEKCQHSSTMRLQTLMLLLLLFLMVVVYMLLLLLLFDVSSIARPVCVKQTKTFKTFPISESGNELCLGSSTAPSRTRQRFGRASHSTSPITLLSSNISIASIEILVFQSIFQLFDIYIDWIIYIIDAYWWHSVMVFRGHL